MEFYDQARDQLVALDSRGPETVEEFIRKIWDAIGLAAGEWSCELEEVS